VNAFGFNGYIPIPEWAQVLGRPLRVAILLRRSKDDPDTKSLEVQRDVNLRFLNFLPEGSWTCDMRPHGEGGDVYSQIVSAWKGDGHHKLLKKILARLGEYDLVVVYKMDRFGRKTLAILQTIEEMREAGVRLYSVVEGYDSADPSKQFAGGLLALVAQLGSDEASVRILGNKALAKKLGGWRGGAITYGYRVAVAELPSGELEPVRDSNRYKTLEHDPDKVKVLREAVDHVVDDGWSVAAVVRELNASGVASPRGFRRLEGGGTERIDWNTTALTRILTNPALKGYDVVGVGEDRFQILEVGGRPHRPHPPIFTDERWHRLQQIICPARPQRRAAKEALLAGLVNCGAHRVDGAVCGRRMYGPSTVSDGNGAYACRVTNNLGKDDLRRCTGNAISAWNLERLVEVIVASIAANTTFKSALKAAYALATAEACGGATDVQAALDDLDRQMADRRAEKMAAKSERLKAQIGRDIEDLDDQIARLEATRPAPSTVVTREVDFDTHWEAMTRPQRRALICDLVEDIEILPAAPQRGKVGRQFDPARVKVTLRNVGVFHLTEPVDLGQPVTCPECEQEFSANQPLSVHRRHKHGVPGAASGKGSIQRIVYACPAEGCDRKTTSAGGLKKHVASVHGSTEVHVCPLSCGRTFVTAADSATHVAAAHAAEDAAVPVCPHCAKVCKTQHGLRVHLGSAHPPAA
jgi:site-specific DNA recombinase